MHAIATCGASDRLYAHRDLCLMDLGLARTVKPGAVAIAELGAAGTLAIDNDALDAWMRRELAPFGGDLARAARFCRALAEARVGLRDGDPAIEAE